MFPIPVTRTENQNHQTSRRGSRHWSCAVQSSGYPHLYIFYNVVNCGKQFHETVPCTDGAHTHTEAVCSTGNDLISFFNPRGCLVLHHANLFQCSVSSFLQIFWWYFPDRLSRLFLCKVLPLSHPAVRLRHYLAHRCSPAPATCLWNIHQHPMTR